MGGRCCRGRLSTGAASILPGAALLLLPKCPLCLAAWMTVVTGASFPAASLALVRVAIMLLWVAAAVGTAAAMVRRDASEPEAQRTLHDAGGTRSGRLSQ